MSKCEICKKETSVHPYISTDGERMLMVCDSCRAGLDSGDSEFANITRCNCLRLNLAVKQAITDLKETKGSIVSGSFASIMISVIIKNLEEAL